MHDVIGLRRDVIDHAFFRGRVDRLGAWIWLLAKACSQMEGGSEGSTKLEWGQLRTSTHLLSRAWNWPPSTVYRFLKSLERQQMIVREALRGNRTIITICNYQHYQTEFRQSLQEPNGGEGECCAGEHRYLRGRTFAVYLGKPQIDAERSPAQLPFEW